jgi:hypothetical protein
VIDYRGGLDLDARSELAGGIALRFHNRADGRTIDMHNASAHFVMGE